MSVNVQEESNERSHTSMTSEERKSRYRNLLDQVETLQENEVTGYETTVALDEIIENANLLFKDSNIKERIKHTDEVLLDAKVVATASDVLLHITESIDCALDTYDHLELARRINSQLLNNDESEDPNYTELSNIACKILNQTPNFSFLYGELGKTNVAENPQKVKQPRRSQRAGRDEQIAKKQPEKVTETNKEEGSVDDTVKFLQWALNKQCEESSIKKMNYFNFIIDPSSYSTTIENMFHFSFLVRDGRAKIGVDKDGVIEITSVSSHDSKKAKRNGVLYKQSIISIDIDEWQAIIKAFNIKNCLLSKWKRKWDDRKKDDN